MRVLLCLYIQYSDGLVMSSHFTFSSECFHLIIEQNLKLMILLKQTQIVYVSDFNMTIIITELVQIF